LSCAKKEFSDSFAKMQVKLGGYPSQNFELQKNIDECASMSADRVEKLTRLGESRMIDMIDKYENWAVAGAAAHFRCTFVFVFQF
jgi:hypothetical protein